MRCVAVAAAATALCALALALSSDARRAPDLLVLRQSCGSEDAANGFERVVGNNSAEDQRVLGYQETCGDGWQTNVMRAGIDTLVAKGAIGVSGWFNSAICDVWRAVAMELNASLPAWAPAVCAKRMARGYAVARLAVHFGWRRTAVLLHNTIGNECLYALSEVISSLIEFGVAVQGGTTKDPTEVLVMCASRVPGVSNEVVKAVNDHIGPVLVLQVFDEGETNAGSADFLKMVDERLPREKLLLVLYDGVSYNDSLDVERAAEEARRDLSHDTNNAQVVFHLYERGSQSGHWTPSGSIKGLDSGVINITTDLSERWCPVHGPAIFSLVNIIMFEMLGGILVTALSVRNLVRRQRLKSGGAVSRNGRNSRNAVWLALTDFLFPAEKRRVDDGMESVLSCLPQRLPEFGGPEPQLALVSRSDLLAQPPLMQRASSLPSSTYSFSRVTYDAKYQGKRVRVRYLEEAAPIELMGKTVDALLLMQNLVRHENINPFIGWLDARDALVWSSCSRGTLEAVLQQDDITLDWTLRLSLLTDLVTGMRFLHSSPLRLHGRLSSSCCLVDARWVLRVSDYGLPALSHAAPLPQLTPPARELLWTAPELLRDGAARVRGSRPGDVYSFAIVMQEVIVRGEPYCMLSLPPEELVERLARPPPLIRPSVSLKAAPPEAVSVMRQCWSENPELRPDFRQLYHTFHRFLRGRNVNISMFNMLDKYSNTLEELNTEHLRIQRGLDSSPSAPPVTTTAAQRPEGAGNSVMLQWSLEHSEEVAAAQCPHAPYRTRPVPAPRRSPHYVNLRDTTLLMPGRE